MGGAKSAGVSQSVRETGRDESQSVPSPEELFKTRDLELPIFEGSLPSCSPHFSGYTRTFLLPYFPVANNTVEPPRMIRGRIFSEMIRVLTQKSELQAKSRSYSFWIEFFPFIFWAASIRHLM